MFQWHLLRFCYNLIWRELLLLAKEKDLQIKEDDSKRNERITMLQMNKKKENDDTFNTLMSNG